MHNLNYLAVAAFGAAFVVTLVLAAFLTPRSWWKRPNVRALSVMVIGTWAIGTLLTGLVQAPAIAASTLHTGSVSPVAGIAPAGGVAYRAYDDLNIRAGKGVGARRLAVVPAGAVVTATGVRDGDWWQVRARVDGKTVEGWSSSLWLRRADE